MALSMRRWIVQRILRVLKRSEEEILSDWAGDIKGLLNLEERPTSLIQKEKMIQSHQMRNKARG
ncbi:hypothetical protein ACHAWU_007741 [Discostella pseudostelligera]|uniref:26S proteasome regulatory subunit RPN5 C-terminal domain-containing protein n=1 Tax=Discostella pseudostelligera TaxID=259834 RepID=A0ABD3M8Q4_9STRA